jgi:two-component system response regulator HydG
MSAELHAGRVLVVDDFYNWRNLLRCILEDNGHQVVTAATHSEAETKLSENAFDVVILDMRLVDEEKYNVQGVALLKMVKKQTPATGAVILTGYPDPLHRDRALNVYGADAYLCKVPEDEDFDIEAFSKLVSSLVQRSHEQWQTKP